MPGLLNVYQYTDIMRHLAELRSDTVEKCIMTVKAYSDKKLIAQNFFAQKSLPKENLSK
jgi:hypothetical protein